MNSVCAGHLRNDKSGFAISNFKEFQEEADLGFTKQPQTWHRWRVP
jgi:hypothetical protein